MADITPVPESNIVSVEESKLPTATSQQPITSLEAPSATSQPTATSETASAPTQPAKRKVRRVVKKKTDGAPTATAPLPSGTTPAVEQKTPASTTATATKETPASVAATAGTKKAPAGGAVAQKSPAPKKEQPSSPTKVSSSARKSTPATQPLTASKDPETGSRRSNFFSNLFLSGTSSVVHNLIGADHDGHDEDHDDHDDMTDDDNNDNQGSDQDDDPDQEHHDDGDMADSKDHESERDNDAGTGENNTNYDEKSAGHAAGDTIGHHSKETSQIMGGMLTASTTTAPVHRAPQGQTTSQPQAKSATTKSEQQPQVKVEEVSTDTSLNEKLDPEQGAGSRVNAKEPITQETKLFLGVGLTGIIVKAINILFPLFFIALGILHVVAIGRPAEDSFAIAVQEVNTIAITIWPIMFAAIATQSLKAYGTFQAERGIKLMTLEQLLHSTSFSSALKQPLLLRRIDWMAILLFILWGLSPLASQALLRIAYTTSGTSSEPLQVNYTRTDSSGLSNRAYMTATNLQTKAMFGGAMMTSKRVAHSSQDAWGNPKIPMLDTLQDPDDQGWFDVDTTSTETQWTSLLGTPHTTDSRNFIVGEQYLTQFTFDSAYYSFDCSPLQSVPAAEVNISAYYGSTANSLFLKITTNVNLGGITQNSGIFDWAFGDGTGNVDGTIANNNYALSSCNFSLVGISAQVNCTSQDDNSPDCAVWKVRPLVSDTLAQGYGIQEGTFDSFFVEALYGAVNGTGTIQELYLSSPDDLFDQNAPKITSLDSTTFSKRAAVLVNTYYQSAGNQTAYLVGLADTSGPFSTSGTIQNISLVWAISTPWVVVFFFCVVIILLFAIADIIWEAYTISPDFLGFASNVVRNNQRLRKEFAGRKLSGHEKARAMADMKVVLQDIAPDKPVGKIALAPAQSISNRLQRERRYDS